MPAKRFWTLALALIGLAGLAFPALAQTYTPTAPALPDLPLQVKAAWEQPAYAPGQTAAFDVTITNPGPVDLAAPPVTITTTLTVAWMDAAGGSYSVAATPATVQVAGGTVSGTKHVPAVPISFPASLTPLARGTAYTFAQQADLSWLVTLPPADIPGGDGAVRVRVMFTVGTPPAH